MRALKDSEYEALKTVLSPRDACVLVLGMRTGYRISEILSLNIGDVFVDGKIVECVRLNRARLKGKAAGRSVPMHTEARDTLERYMASVNWEGERLKRIHPNGIPLFLSKNGWRLNRTNYWNALKKGMHTMGLSSERVATHSFRKAFIQKLYVDLNGDLFKLQVATGHKSLSSLSAYVQVDESEVWEAIKRMK